MNHKGLFTIAASLAAAMLGMPAAVADDDGPGNRRYEVTITNVSPVQFTPLLVVAHKADISLFEAGDVPGEALALLAEGGALDPMIGVLNAVPDLVGDYETTEGLLEPGKTVVVELDARRPFDRISVAAMLLPTNDSFVGLNSVAAPARRNLTARFMAVGYDAGSEPNDELCANIPGPTCMGAGPSPDSLGEGYVRVSPGIQGVGDLDPAAYDWRNPVAVVRVRRVH